MNEKDITQKTLESYNDIFADIVNVLLFDGERIVAPDDLIDATTFSRYKLTGPVRSQDRDVAKYWRNERIRIALVGLENQTDPDRDMPLRIMGYDGAAYRDQLNQDKLGDSKERFPVITLILYFGHEKKWDHHLTLKDCFSISPPLEPYVSDYHINIFQIAYLDRETIDKFTSDFWFLADYCYQMRTTGEYISAEGTAVYPKAVFEALAAITGDSHIEEAVKLLLQYICGQYS